MRLAVSHLAALVALLGAACSSSKKDGITGSTGQQSPTRPSTSTASGTQTGATDFVDDEEPEDLESIDDEEGGEQGDSLEEMLKQCGVDTANLDDPNFVVMDKQIRSWPKVFTGTEKKPFINEVNYRVSVVTKIDVRATMSEVKMTTDFDIQATPSAALGPAEEKVAPNRGTSRSKILSKEERTTLMTDNEDWSGILCTIQPAKELATYKGGFVKEVSFNPPLPSSVSPKADAKRYAAEIGANEGAERVFSNIEAEITRSNDPAFPKGRKLTGTVKITRVKPVLKLQIGAGGETKEIKADAAFRIEADFDGVEGTVGIGLMPSQTYYVDYSKRDVRVIVADTGFAEGGTVVLSDDL